MKEIKISEVPEEILGDLPPEAQNLRAFKMKEEDYPLFLEWIQAGNLPERFNADKMRALKEKISQTPAKLRLVKLDEARNADPSAPREELFTYALAAFITHPAVTQIFQESPIAQDHFNRFIQMVYPECVDLPEDGGKCKLEIAIDETIESFQQITEFSRQMAPGSSTPN